MTGCATLDAVEREDVLPGYRLPFDYSGLVERVQIILGDFWWLSLVGECLMALEDGQGPPLGVLYLVVSSPFGLLSIFILFYFIMFILGAVLFVGKFNPSDI